VRIVHAADSFAPDTGGIETQVEALSRHQRAQGHDVTVITAVHEDADLDLSVVRAASGRWLTVAFPWRNHRMVAEVLDGPPVDIVHAHFTVISPLAIYVARAASRRGIPVAITVHSLWWQVATATRLSMLPFGWGRIRAAWSGVSRVAAGHVRRTLPGVGEVSVVPNLVETQWWQPTAPVRETGSGEIRLALVGRLKKRKHVNEFLDVLARVRPRVGPDVTVQVGIVGDGPRRRDLQRMVDRLGLSDWVTFLGRLPPAGVRAFLHQSDLFVAPCRQESFGIAALEARAAGLPVVGYRGSGLTEFIADGVDGVLIADADEMVEALVTLIGRPDELERLRKTTTTTPPSITVHETVSAVEAVYRRARTGTP
jgi:glycosyltransferase involved in cell wall biosynthesis